MGSFELTDRSRRLLATLVREYIETGEAVSSQVLARESSLGVSSATVRNVLAQLEDAGYVYQPHTSAGRVPTDRGYRIFVDLLLEGRKPAKPSANVETRLRQAERSPLVGDLLADISHLVARAARQVGFAMAANDGAILQRIEFVPLGGAKVLVVVVASDGNVTQKAVEADHALRPGDLDRAANYLNTEFAGLPLVEVRDAVLARLEMDRSMYDELLRRALRLAQASLDDISRQQAFSVEGASSLLEHNAPDGASLATLRALLEMMDEKERMVHLLNQYIDGPGLTVVIGAEHAAPGLRAFSLIAATVVDGGTMRTVGVIGPTRMDYSRTIALVDGTTQAVSRVLRNAS
jgi:heat-inducible transcriptional repressor